MLSNIDTQVAIYLSRGVFFFLTPSRAMTNTSIAMTVRARITMTTVNTIRRASNLNIWFCAVSRTGDGGGEEDEGEEGEGLSASTVSCVCVCVCVCV